MNLVKQTFHWVHDILDHIKSIEMALIAALFWWSFILAVPLDTFGTGSSYNAMKSIAPEEVWSGVFFLVAILNIYGLISERYKVRIIGLCIQAGLWFFVSAMFAMGDLASTGTGIYFIVALLNSFVVYKVGEGHGR